MTKYLVVSEKVGVVGDYFEPGEYINVQALIEGGFIAVENDGDISTVKPKKSPTIKTAPKE